MEYHYSDKNNSKFNHIGPDYISKPSHAKCLSLMLQAYSKNRLVFNSQTKALVDIQGVSKIHLNVIMF